jgi:hypothetical protein
VLRDIVAYKHERRVHREDVQETKQNVEQILNYLDVALSTKIMSPEIKD